MWEGERGLVEGKYWAFGHWSLLGQDPTLWTGSPALHIFLSSFQGSVWPCLSPPPSSRCSPSLLGLSFLLLERWR